MVISMKYNFTSEHNIINLLDTIRNNGLFKKLAKALTELGLGVL